jgi:CBS domain-containing protein
MKKEVISVKPDDPALDALNMLFKMQISGLPVIDAQGKLLGMFTEKNVLAHVLPSYIEKVGRFVYEDDPKSAKKKFMDLGRAKVKELMRSDVVTTTPDAALSEVGRVMLTQRARRLPVVDKEGKVVGIVARCDIVGALAREAGISAPAG